jgi:pimeloyl-ACP methyl ester carboxylesterase
MAEPQIRYCTADDGVSIAYWSLGSGPLLVLCPPGPIGHIAAELRIGDLKAWYERLARSFTIVRYDPRGSGSSHQGNVVSHPEAERRLGRWLQLVCEVNAIRDLDLIGEYIAQQSPIPCARRKLP